MRDIFAQTAEATHPGACCAFTYDQLGLIAARAAARGEAAFDVDEAVDHVIAPIAYHILFGRREPTLAYANALLDRFWRWREASLT